MTNGRIVMPEAHDAALAKRAPDLTITMDEAHRIARLAFLIAYEQRRNSGLVLTGQRSWDGMTSEQRKSSALGVLRVVQAMILLGYVEPPDATPATLIPLE
jgi:hypothetical protein